MVQWGSKSFSLDVNLSAPVSVLMENLHSLTGVPIENQRLLMRRSRLEPASSWPEGLKQPIKLMLIGSTKEQTDEVKLFKDPKPEPSEQPEPGDQVIPSDSVGLANLGNTCYMAAVLQVLRNLPKFSDQLKTSHCDANKLGEWIIKFFNNPEKEWAHLVTLFRICNKDFAKTENADYQQQDAAEFWTYLMKHIRTHIGESVTNPFTIKYKVVQENTKTSETIESEEYDDKITCSVDENVKEITQGVSMVSEVEKPNKDAEPEIWTIRKQITEVPVYLTLQLLRFFYKTSEGHTVKLFRLVDHPQYIDMLPWVTPELRAKWVEKRESYQSASKKCPGAGYYELKAIVAHKGRTPDSGHYVSFVRSANKEWVKYDDSDVEVVTEEQIAHVRGGADWFCNYILIYEMY